jgi:hypothetical protein
MYEWIETYEIEGGMAKVVSKVHKRPGTEEKLNRPRVPV